MNSNEEDVCIRKTINVLGYINTSKKLSDIKDIVRISCNKGEI